MNDESLRKDLCKLATSLADWNIMIPERENMSPTVLLEGLLLILNHKIDPIVFMATHNYNPLDFNDVHYYIPPVREPIPGDLILFVEIMSDPDKLGIITRVTVDEYTLGRLLPVEANDQKYYRITQEIIPKDYPDIGIFYAM